MITEDYVSFETAKLLKEKGFDDECNYEYGVPVVERGYVLQMFFKPIKNSELVDEAYAAPTLQMAMKWLREKHNIAIETEWEHLWYAYIKPMTSKPSEEDYCQCKSSKYEEACEAAIKYCLENLI